MKYVIKENKEYKSIEGDDFNLVFRKVDGYTMTWGKTKEDDPDFSPVGPIIADIEISEACHEGCDFCYKANTPNGRNMSFNTFKEVFHQLPRSLTQIAFGIGSIDTNKDLRRIFDYCLNNEYQTITPNVTINGSRMTNGWYDYIAKTCGAVAVSHYGDDKCFNAVKELTSRGMKQVNIHCMLSEETFTKCMDLIEKVKKDERLSKLNAVVFLMLKPRGRGEKYHRLSEDKYKIFINKLMNAGINYGFDSCGAARLLTQDIDENIKKYITPCESTRESCYINVEGRFFPCSFAEDGEGIDVTKVDDFLKDVWFDKRIHDWRNNLIKNNCECPIYNV